MSGLFGPQNGNVATSLPVGTEQQRYGIQQTFVKDCSAPGRNDGTILDAAFYNRIIGNLEALVSISGVVANPGDMTTLYRAILAAVSQGAPAALDTLNELANALNNDPNFATHFLNSLANCIRSDVIQSLPAGQQAQAAQNMGLATVARSGAYNDLGGTPTLGTAAAKNTGTGAGNVVALDGSAKLPAVDGSQLLNISAAAGAILYTALQSLTSTQRSTARANIGVFGKNRLFNGRFNVDQLNAGTQVSIASNGYGVDGCRVLTESGNVTIQAQRSDSGLYQTNVAVQAGTNALKFGILMPIENANMRDLPGVSAAISSLIAVSNAANLSNVKLAIIQWAGTKDAISASPISAWNGAGVNPTLVTNWSYVTTPVNLVASTTPTKFSATGIVASAPATNLAAFIWVDSKSHTTADLLYVSDVQIEAGPVATAYETRSIQHELEAARRYLSVRSLTVLNPYSANVGIPQGQWFPFVTPMLRGPACTASNQVYSNCTAVLIDKVTVDGFRGYVTNAAAGASQADFTLTADARL